MKRKLIVIVSAAAVLITIGICVVFFAFKLDHKRIYTAEDLIGISSDPNGKYLLMNDIDMSGYEWTPFVFGGVLDGNGHKIQALSIRNVGGSTRITVDGNRKEYEAGFAGMFDVLTGEVRNLVVVDINVDVKSDQPFFAGSIAGFLEDGIVSDCRVTGTVRLDAHNGMFGVGGVTGAGYGMITDSVIDVTLICIDTDSETKDEQFMGGVCAVGYPDIVNCNVTIDGYDSEHGYVHNGGLMGMYIYEEGIVREGQITGNRVAGKITFFEDNDDRRAYCDWYIGEVMSVILGKSTNEEDFESIEIFEYDKVLLPLLA
ncbi:hypothetical protein SAMN02910456_01704 [Ruminococcaceae bacterium YRB3002]|nr:hypothetical protein SAMN02910456_01704 [Ruminococcaceae bacterium YRB3002]